MSALILAEIVPASEFFGSYTYRTMLIGTVLIGLFSGGLGCLLYQRKQSLLADVIGHSAIAGVVGAFIVSTAVFNVNGRSMATLTIGAVISSALAALLANVISAHSRVSIDAAMAICIIAQSTLPNRQGINTYLFGNAATLTTEDNIVILVFGLIAVGVAAFTWRGLTLFIFDPVFATMSGYSGRTVSTILFLVTTTSIVIGVKTVGLVLMIAFAIMPAAAARLWVRHMHTMIVLAAILGAVCGAAGSYLAVCMGRVPTGPVIVVVLFVVFAFSASVTDPDPGVAAPRTGGTGRGELTCHSSRPSCCWPSSRLSPARYPGSFSCCATSRCSSTRCPTRCCRVSPSERCFQGH